MERSQEIYFNPCNVCSLKLLNRTEMELLFLNIPCDHFLLSVSIFHLKSNSTSFKLKTFIRKWYVILVNLTFRFRKKVNYSKGPKKLQNSFLFT